MLGYGNNPAKGKHFMSPIPMTLQCRQGHTAVKILEVCVWYEPSLPGKEGSGSDIFDHGRSLDCLSVCPRYTYLLVNVGFLKNSCKHGKVPRIQLWVNMECTDVSALF